MPESPSKCSSSKWLHPNQVLQLHRLKAKKRALQDRINKPKASTSSGTFNFKNTEAPKRSNPFLTSQESKKPKLATNLENSNVEDSTDQTLFKLLNFSATPSKPTSESLTSFNNILNKLNASTTEDVQIVKAKGESWIPVDWTLKSKIRFLSSKPFAWNQKLKISEEASGVTAFARCLGSNSGTSLDSSPNAKFHQCCLYWQQPSLPWLKLFPRTNAKVTSSNGTINVIQNPAVRESLMLSWSDGFRSLFHLIRTRQCPYFYICANNFTVLFRAGGICGFTEMNALITPTTRGFRYLLKQAEIEYSMPLKPKRLSDQGYETNDSVLGSQSEENDGENDVDDDETPDEQWLESMGIRTEDIKKINYTQAKIAQKSECQIDNSEQSLVLVEGMEVQALYNLLLNCKSTVAATGLLAGIPPTLLAPVAFNGATLNALKVRENKVHVDDSDYYSLELSGPILPTTVHNLCLINPSDHSMTATFSNVANTLPFSKIKCSEQDKNSAEKNVASGSLVFGQENLSDCGLNPFVLKKFCHSNDRFMCNVECLKYTGDTKSYTWT